jgi:hypothetical protein
MVRPALLTGVAAVCAAAALVGGGVTWALDSSDSSPGTPSAQPFAVETSFPGLTPAAGEPVLPGTAAAAPAAGRVGRVAGPFDDRFRLDGLSLRDGRVTGALTVTSDVSDLIELQVQVSYYDAQGALLGVRRWTHHVEEEHAHTGPPSERERFSTVAPAAWRGQVASAAVGVPVLVNE